jgi:hypothetical protein
VQISVEEQNLSALVSCRRVLDRLVDATADDIRTRRALDQKPACSPSPRPSTGRNPGHIDLRDPLRRKLLRLNL